MKPAWRCKRMELVLAGTAMLAGILGFPGASRAQGPQPRGKSLPDSPQPKNSGGTSQFVGYMTNRSLFFPNIATSPNSLSTGKKFELFVNEAVSPPTFLIAGISAAYGQAKDTPKDYGQGASGYFSRFGSSVGRGASNSFFGTFVLASLLHEDPRYFPHSHPTLWSSVKYAAKRVVITRKDNGDDTFNASGLIGTLAGETLANTYLPTSEQTGGDTLKRFGTDMGWQFAGNVFKEYWPTLFKSLGLKNLKIMPDPANSTH